MRVTIVGWSYDADLADEEALLDRYTTLTGWSEAIRSAGVNAVTVVHRFSRESAIVRNHITYHFCRDSGGARLSAWAVSPGVTASVLRSRPDIVHVNGMGFPLQTWRLRQQLAAGTAVVVQDHASGAPQPPTAAWTSVMRHAVRRRAMRAADAFFFTAAAQADPWRASGLIGDSQLVIAIAESSASMRPVSMDDGRAGSGMTGDPAVLWVGRLNANKDPLAVIDACAIAKTARPGLTLTMVYGEGDLLGLVTERIAAHPVLDRSVRLVGPVPHGSLNAYYSAADVFVLGSHHEGSGYAVIEACACGLPPAVTDIPSFRALTGGGAVGRLWPVGDARACADAILAIADERRCQSRAKVRTHFERTLSWDAVGRRARAAYDEIVRDRRTRGGAAAG